ncbi:MAG: hypothetical protein IT338_18420 [Thermomicrobiales bacterium]|nr:hypothetical protein [Thermomicrobiales bacterium]
MSEERGAPTGEVSTTPEGGPIGQGVPAPEPGAGYVRATPEGSPLDEGEVLAPPSWQEHMKGPIPGLDDTSAQARPAAAAPGQAPQGQGGQGAAPWPSTQVPPPEKYPQGFPPQHTAAWGGGSSSSASAGRDEAEQKTWPPYSGKPVSDVGDVMRYAAPIVAQAEKLTIRAIDLSGRGLTKLAGFLEERRLERNARQEREQGFEGDR